MDPYRDSGMVYERALREEAGVETREDVYKRTPHAFWSMYPGIEATKRSSEDSLRGMAWPLGREMDGVTG